MASTCCQPIAYSSPYASIKFLKLPASYDASVFRGFQLPPAVGQSLPSARRADLSEDGETLDSDDDHHDLPSVKQILASAKRAKRVIDLTGDDDDDRKGGDGDFSELSWLRTTRTARYLVRLIPPSLIDRIQVTGQLRSPYTALSVKASGTHCRRPYNVASPGRKKSP